MPFPRRHTILLTSLMAVILLLGSGLGQRASAQFYYNGRGPASTRWLQTKSPDYKLVYPIDFSPTGRALASFLDSIAPSIGHGFRMKSQRLPIILYPEDLYANGEVVWAPKRTELMVAPPAGGGLHADLWMKQLAIHEARHVVQLSNLRGGLTKALSYLFGQAGTSIGMLCLSRWFLEGDAVLAETQFSEYGRGLQPEFTVGLRGFLATDPSRVRMHSDRWVCGSYREFRPGLYETGYQIVAAGERHFGTDSWGKAVEFTGRYPILVTPMRIYLHRHYGIRTRELSTLTLTELRDKWAPHSAVSNDYETLTWPGRSYTTYAAPLWDSLREGIIALKSDYDTPPRIVRFWGDLEASIEQTLAWIGPLSSRPVLSGERLYWTEYKPHPIWEYKTYSVVRSLDLKTGRRSSWGRRQANYFITPITRPDGTRLFASITPNRLGGSCLVLRRDDFSEIDRRDLGIASVHGLSWDAQAGLLSYIQLDERGMSLQATDVQPWFEGKYVFGLRHELTAPSMTTLSDLSGDGHGSLYFGSIQSGKDEIHTLDLRTGEQYRLTTSRFGAYAPTPLDSGSILLTTYTPDGPMVARAELSAPPQDTVRWSRLPNNILNIPGPQWEVPKMSQFSLAALGDTLSPATHTTKRYHKGLRWFNVHSWIPGVAFNQQELIDEQSVQDFAFGLSLFFQSVMGDSYGGASYGIKGGDNWVNGMWAYAGLPVQFKLTAEYGGGNQLIYLSQNDYDAGVRPPADLKNYFRLSFNASLPLQLSGGSHYRLLQPSLTVSHYNALLYDPAIQGYHHDYQKYTASLWWSDNRRASVRAILPRLGYALRADYTGALQVSFGRVYSLFGRGYLPGFLPNHTITLRGGAMYQDGSQWNFTQKPLLPRGSDNSYAAQRYGAVALDYTFPVCYPDGGINGVVYLKRIWANVFGDYSAGDYFVGGGQTTPMNQHSWGADLALEMNIFSSVEPVTLKFTLAAPSDNAFFFGFGLSMNF